jgi:surface polysaccharide O-acyltransferase-like enzyme
MTHNASFDIARLVAIFGVVLFHAGAPGGQVGLGGLVFFVMLLPYFGLRSRTSLAQFARSRATRLLWPWLVWSIIYGGLKVLDVVESGRPISSEFEAWMWATGPALHLWFLPWAFVAGCAVHILGRALPRSLLGVLGASVALAGSWVLALAPWPTPVAQWIFALPGLGLGLLLAAYPSTGLWLSVAVLALAAGLGWFAGLLQAAVALAGVAVCVTLPLAPSLWTRGIADAALVVYLAHPLVASLLFRGTGIPRESLISVALTMGLSLMLAGVLRWYVAGKSVPA